MDCVKAREIKNICRIRIAIICNTRVLQDIILDYLPDRDNVPYLSTWKRGVVHIHNGNGRSGNSWNQLKKSEVIMDVPKVEIRKLL